MNITLDEPRDARLTGAVIDTLLSKHGFDLLTGGLMTRGEVADAEAVRKSEDAEAFAKIERLLHDRKVAVVAASLSWEEIMRGKSSDVDAAIRENSNRVQGYLTSAEVGLWFTRLLSDNEKAGTDDDEILKAARSLENPMADILRLVSDQVEAKQKSEATKKPGKSTPRKKSGASSSGDAGSA